MDSLLETFLFESNTLIENLDEMLIDSEKTGDFTQDEINEIFRSMHTIKGSSAMMEFKPLMEIAHHVEDLFFEIRDNGMSHFTKAQKDTLFDILFRSVDRMRGDLEKVENGTELSDDVSDFIAQIADFIKEIKGEELAVVSPASEHASSDVSVEAGPESPNSNIEKVNAPYVLHVIFDKDCGMENLRAFILVNSFRDAGLDQEFYPADVETNSDTCEFLKKEGFFIGFFDEASLNRAIANMESMSYIHSYNVSTNANSETKAVEDSSNANDNFVTSKPEGVQDKKKEATSPKFADNGSDASKQAKQSLISVNLDKLDSLMAIVGEIVITESMVIDSPELKGLKLDGFAKSTSMLRKLTDDLQDIAMSLRMVPVSGVFQKMNRIVRDMAKSLNKDVRLSMIGGDAEVDKTIVDSIGDPLMHVIRNAMDHGIEATKEDRIAAGKDPQGEVTLSAKHMGSDVVISISDDGRGINTDAVLAKAEKRGILTKPAEAYTEKEKLELIMAPGFSMNADVTQYSGRGVGMDVVKKNLETIGGTLLIENRPGAGSTFIFKIPLTLAIVSGMEINVGDAGFTIPIQNIKQSFKASEGDILKDTSGNEIIPCMGEFYPLVRLNRHFNIPTNCPSVDEGIIMWLEAGSNSFCLLVDELVGEKQVVVKPLPQYLSAFKIKEAGISGCSIMGNGDISVILDAVHILNSHNEISKNGE